MQYTTNYNLPQWEATDRITRSSVKAAASAAATAQSTANSAAAAAAGAGKWQLIKTVTLSVPVTVIL